MSGRLQKLDLLRSTRRCTFIHCYSVFSSVQACFLPIHGNGTVTVFIETSTIVALKCISTVDHAGPRFWYCLTHAFGKAIIETSKIHNLFIQYPNNIYFSALEFS
jgi:hypothetical protein